MKGVLFVIMVAATLAACADRGDTLGLMADQAVEMEMPAAVADPEEVPEHAVAAQERKIVRQGEIRFAAADAAATRRDLLAATAATGGYVGLDSSDGGDSGVSHTMTLRVPAAHFDTLLAAVSAAASHVDYKRIDAQDVTEQYIDMAARVKTKKEIEARYIDLLRRAGTITEVLEVERELGTLRADIESIEGRLRYLSDRVAISSLTATFYERGEGGFGFPGRFGEALAAGWKNLLWALIGLTHIWPLLVVAAIALTITIAVQRRRAKA